MCVRGTEDKKVLLQSLGARIDFTDDELMFSALNHDLGKLGSLDGEQYQPNDSDQHVKNQGKIYKMNTDIHQRVSPIDHCFYYNTLTLSTTKKNTLL